VEFEELTQGQSEDDEPTGLGSLAWAAIAVGCVLAGAVLMLFRTGVESVSEPQQRTPLAVPNSGPSREDSLTLVLNPEQRLRLGRICQAVRVDRNTLAVSVTVVNDGDVDVILMDVEPVLIGGLKPRGPNTAGGTCEQPGTEAPGGLLTPGATQLVTMRFRLPEQCAQPSPLPVRVDLRVHQMVGTTTVPLSGDLGSVTFDRCPR
jgi:hypothetical protein